MLRRKETGRHAKDVLLDCPCDKPRQGRKEGFMAARTLTHTLPAGMQAGGRDKEEQAACREKQAMPPASLSTLSAGMARLCSALRPAQAPRPGSCGVAERFPLSVMPRGARCLDALC